MSSAAVLTGDIIDSTTAGAAALERTMAALAAAAGEIAAWSTPGDVTRFGRHRGDGWQLAIKDGSLGLRAALFIIARLHADPDMLSTRIAIGIGPVDHFGTAGLSDARGAAFVASGRALDAMGRLRTLTIDGPGIGPLHHAVVELLEEHARRWTREQAEAAALALNPDNPTLKDIATVLGISPQAVNYRWRGGGVLPIRRALDRWESEIQVMADKKDDGHA